MDLVGGRSKLHVESRNIRHSLCQGDVRLRQHVLLLASHWPLLGQILSDCPERLSVTIARAGLHITAAVGRTRRV